MDARYSACQCGRGLMAIAGSRRSEAKDVSLGSCTVGSFT